VGLAETREASEESWGSLLGPNSPAFYAPIRESFARISAVAENNLQGSPDKIVEKGFYDARDTRFAKPRAASMQAL
jgi:hypothetical protein